MPRPTVADDLSQNRADRSPSKESRRPSKDSTSKARTSVVYGKGIFSSVTIALMNDTVSIMMINVLHY